MKLIYKGVFQDESQLPQVELPEGAEMCIRDRSCVIRRIACRARPFAAYAAPQFLQLVQTLWHTNFDPLYVCFIEFAIEVLLHPQEVHYGRKHHTRRKGFFIL